jgi:hypothetical protein
MDTMVSALIHLANRDYPSLVDDFIALNILPADCDRQKVVPLMDKALTPYVKGGGAQRYEEELRKMYGMDGTFAGTTGGFQAMTQDALTVLNDIPFSIPPYFALLARAIVTLEGLALTGRDPPPSFPFPPRLRPSCSVPSFSLLPVRLTLPCLQGIRPMASSPSRTHSWLGSCFEKTVPRSRRLCSSFCTRPRLEEEEEE